MSRTNNTSCSVCHRDVAKWLCRCANEAICQGGSCLAAHMAKSGRSHVLVEYELGIELRTREDECYMKSVNSALEAVEFVRAEGERLMRERDRIAREVDLQIEGYVNQIRSYGERKKQELDRLLQVSIEMLEFFKTEEKREYVLQTKQKGDHLAALSCVFRELESDSLIKLKGNELRYQLAKRNEKGSWSFGGDSDALSFKASKDIELTGISLCKGKTKRELMLHSLEILKGNTTTSEVIYRDTEKRYMDSDHPFMVDIGFNKVVPIAANTHYTVKVLMLGCSGLSTSELECVEQNGLKVTPSSTIFNGNEGNNQSDSRSGIFYELHYVD